MANKDKKRQNKATIIPLQEIPPAQVLVKFKSMWANRNCIGALSIYRSWINKTGKKSDPQIECELLIRSAEERLLSYRPDQAIQFLDEAGAKSNDGTDRFRYYKAIIYAQTGKLAYALELFEELHDDFHASILHTLIEAKKTLPKKIESVVRFEKSQLLGVWKAITGAQDEPAGNPALKNLITAYHALATGEDPEQQLALLRNKAGWENVAAYLLLLTSVSQRRNIKIRNILKANPELVATRSWSELIHIHLIELLEEKTHGEVLAIKEIVDRSDTRVTGVDKLYDEALFRASLDEVAQNRFEPALGFLLKIRDRTPQINHNIGLCCQKLKKYREANDYWIKILRSGPKPKKTDPEDVRAAFVETCKHIAQNYREDDDLPKAYAYLKESFYYDEDDKDTLRDICEICAEMERYDEALLYAKRLIELEPENETYLLLYSMEARLAGKTDDIIATLEDFCAKNPGNIFFAIYTASIYLDKAWLSWNEKAISIDELKNRIEHIKNIDPDFSEYRIHYLEAVLLEAAGKTKAANTMIKQAFDRTKLHSDECDLASALYNDGKTVDAVKGFMKAASCSCEDSFYAVERIIEFFIEKEDRKKARLFCDYAVEKKKDPPGFIADLLIDNGWLDLALTYSLMEIEKGGDPNDYYRHITILNRLGNKENLLGFAYDFLAKAEEEYDVDEVSMIKQLIKEIKARGRFRE